MTPRCTGKTKESIDIFFVNLEAHLDDTRPFLFFLQQKKKENYFYGYFIHLAYRCSMLAAVKHMIIDI